jgi:hypothetical protein
MTTRRSHGKWIERDDAIICATADRKQRKGRFPEWGARWNHTAESHFPVGDSMGREMVDLLNK